MVDPIWHLLNYVVIDVEGNGAQPPDLVELAVVPIFGDRIGQPHSWLVKPSTPISWQAQRVHGISNAGVADQPVFAEIASEVRDLLGDFIPIGHNVGIDLAVIKRLLPQWTPREALDTLRIARKIWTLSSYRLAALVEFRQLAADIPSDLRPHRATYDALVTARLFIDMANNSGPVPLTLSALRKAGGLNLRPIHSPEPELRLFN
jgi:exodeoxyribonuclease X